MGLLHPQLLLLALPAALLWARTRGRDPGPAVLRALVLLLLVLAAAAPYLRTGEDGRDLVVVVDRSRSMPAGAEARVQEILAQAEEARNSGDRVAVVGFGARVGIERPPEAGASLTQFQRAIDPDGSDVGAALEAALGLVSEGRPASILLVSDGEANGRDPLDAARAAFARGVRIDTIPIVRESVRDVAVERLDLPEEVGVLEPFQFHAWVRSEAELEVEFVLERDGETLARGRHTLQPGATPLAFRDVLTRPGTASYRLRILGTGDDRPENDTGVAALRVTGQRSVLLVNEDGGEDALSHALRAAAIPLEVVAPEGGRLTRLALTGVRAVVLENVAAERIGSAGMNALREFVLQRGGGLLMTGGRASFGLGGYHLSPLDECLPVSMEMRQEARKIGVALAIALDRSGSMGVEVRPGVPKMDLANLGTCAAIELLSPIDSIGVLAVDSVSHTVQELVPVEDIAALTARVRTIESGGGGIFCYSALLAAGKLLEGATQHNRHIVLFADANDSEEQERCPELIARLREMGVTLSVVALGTESDSDAAFLREIAALGGGECHFTHEPEDLPRLFAQDTLNVARATFVEEPVACTALPDLFGLGDALAGGAAFPDLGGHNVVWLREDATCGVVTEGEFRVPAFAFTQAGLGRSAAFAGQIGGTFGADLVAWEGFASFFVTTVRWLAGQEEPDELFASAWRLGREASFRVEVDPRAPVPPDTTGLEVHLGHADGTTEVLPLERVGEYSYEARTTLAREGVALGAVRLADGRSLGLPPLVLPYSPEFEVSDPTRGEALMRDIARTSGGESMPPLGTLFRGDRRARVWRVVTRECALLALLVLLLEITLRRLQLWGSVAALAARVRARSAMGRTSVGRSATPMPTSPPSAPVAAPGSEPGRPSIAREEAGTRPPPAAKPAATMDDALRTAQRAARRRLDR